MRGRDQIIVVDVDVPDGNHGQVGLQALPVPAVIKRNEHAFFRSRVEQSLTFSVNADSVRVVASGNAVVDRGPGFAEVGGFEDIRREVVEPVPLYSDVGW